ncbi:hypothetical protein [Sphingobacterium athyrii]|uniref:hypothetical protein n=1 Tax=Sphingobacterium athyrii TaxID=2152717 RepID=UPI0028AFDE4E|nr:hypothetical protein [Sphingobacterium athyrii]
MIPDVVEGALFEAAAMIRCAAHSTEGNLAVVMKISIGFLTYVTRSEIDSDISLSLRNTA